MGVLSDQGLLNLHLDAHQLEERNTETVVTMGDSRLDFFDFDHRRICTSIFSSSS